MLGAMRSEELVKYALAFAVLASSAFLTTVSEAQPWTGERIVPGRPHRIEGDGALYARNEQWVFSPSLRARLRAIEDRRRRREGFILDVDLAARAVGIAGPADSFRLGNPYVGVRFGYRHPVFVARGGIGTTAPLTNAFDDGPEDHYAYRLGQAVHGMHDAWLLEPEIQPLVFRGDFELHGRHGYFGFDAAVAAIFPVRDTGPNGNTEVVFQTGAYAAWTPVDVIALGVRLSVFFATNWRVGFWNEDEAQLSMIPFFRLDLVPAFFEIRLVMNLDDPYGFAFDDTPYPTDAVWAVTLTAGGRF